MIRFLGRSGTISEQELELCSPKPQDERSLGRIGRRNTLYRRFQPHHFDSNGDLIPTFFAFPDKRSKRKSGQSFLLKGIALPIHALHRNCNDGKPLGPGEWGVLKLRVKHIPEQIRDPENRTFYFKPIHVPYSSCKAHCELFCSNAVDSDEYVVPGTVVKTSLRIQLSRKFKPIGIRLIVPGGS